MSMLSFAYVMYPGRLALTKFSGMYTSPFSKYHFIASFAMVVSALNTDS